MLPIFPSGMNTLRLLFGYTDIDVEWKKLLKERLGKPGEAHDNAKAF
jgi:hypothetical protein